MTKSQSVFRELFSLAKVVLILAALVFAQARLHADRHETRGTATDLGRMLTKYRVPAPAELSKYAEYQLKGVHFEMVDGAVTKLSYALPLELTGISDYQSLAAFELDGTKSKLMSDNGSIAECDVNFCHVKYKDLEINMVARNLALRERFSDPLEFEKRLQVAELFRDDPGGTLEIDFFDKSKKITPSRRP